jgi:hypothetical protein
MPASATGPSPSIPAGGSGAEEAASVGACAGRRLLLRALALLRSRRRVVRHLFLLAARNSAVCWVAGRNVRDLSAIEFVEAASEGEAVRLLSLGGLVLLGSSPYISGAMGDGDCATETKSTPPPVQSMLHSYATSPRPSRDERSSVSAGDCQIKASF